MSGQGADSSGYQGLIAQFTSSHESVKGTRAHTHRTVLPTVKMALPTSANLSVILQRYA